MLIWSFLLASVYGNIAQSSSTPLDYTMYTGRAMHNSNFVSVEMRHRNVTGADYKLLHNSTLSELE
jgi:hypothetical protein